MFDPFSPLLFASFIFLAASLCHLEVTEIHMIVLFLFAILFMVGYELQVRSWKLPNGLTKYFRKIEILE